MLHDAPCADAPRSLKRLLDPLSSLLGVPVTVSASAHASVWPDPGNEAHAMLHREFAERGPCPLLEHPGSIPLDGNPPVAVCPLGLVIHRFSMPLGGEQPAILTLGPYFANTQDRIALCGRSPAADAALAMLPLISPDRQELLREFYCQFAAFVGTAVMAGAAKETFLANMSHELRTPLNGIMGMLSLLLQGELGARQRQFLELAMDASQQLLGVVNDLLEMTNISMGRLELAEEPFELRQCLAPLFAACAEDAARRGLSFTAAIDAGVPESLVGDPARLRQIMLNLLQNAIKFTEQGSIEVQISRQSKESGSQASTLLFSVRDTGIGIPGNKQHYIFERFAIGEDFLNKRYGKTGLGLSISKEIVEKMGGSIRLASSPGQGSAFFFTAVFRHAETSALQEATAALGPAASGRRAVIVYAETEPISQMLVRRILEDGGYLPLVVDSGEKLHEILRTRPVDMLLLDIQRPDLAGIESARRIRDGQLDGVPRNLPIVGLTVGAAAEDRQRGLAAGMTEYLTKPVTRQELLDTVARALAGIPTIDPLKFPAA